MKPVNISGISESRVAPVAAYIKKGKSGQGLIIVSSHVRAKRLGVDLSFFYSGRIYILPEQEETFIRYDARSREPLFERMKALKALETGEDCIVIAPVSAAVRKLAPHRYLADSSLKIERGCEMDPAFLRERLALMGYERTSMVDGRGQFSVRGEIIDIFTPEADNPYRIEFFDTEVDSVRSFDMDTQRSLENLKYITVFPAVQILNDKAIFEKAARKVDSEYTAHIRRLEKRLAEKEEENQRQTIERLKERKGQLTEYIENGSNMLLMENYLQYFYDETEYIWDYLKDDSVIMVDDPDRVHEALNLHDSEIKEDFTALLEKGYVIPADFRIYSSIKEYSDVYKREGIYFFTPFRKQVKGVPEYGAIYYIQSKQTPVFNGRMDLLKSELDAYVKNGYKVTIVCSSRERLENLKEFLEREGLDEKVWLKEGELTSGIEFTEEKLCYIRDGDIFTERKKISAKKRRDKSSGQKLQSFADLKNGDYVVHENHGIGKFLGIEQLSVQGVKKDYLKIKYAGQDMLYVPVEQMDLVQKYIGGDNGTPKINKLSGSEWKATKAKAKAAIASMAQELIELSAARQMEKGYAFGEDTLWQAEFEDSFPYQETEDQLRCTNEIKRDMEKPEAMDRLLCGDVGYGKTEVAARAMFKCLADGKQAAVLVPTTILANQHYYTLKERFERFPFTVEMLSRFRSEKQQEITVDKLGQGSVDLIIGTHRLLSKDVKFKDLGLLVIDEEQRFGVQHKETIKMMRKNVDVLTLSATPIPRTLHMSLSGIKDMSLIEEPPEERYPVQTYVLEQDMQLMREIIERELGRGGQVYIVFNRVQGIHKIAKEVAELVPEAKIAVGHGQMNEQKLENIMLDFVNGEVNVLIATTIIESGIDIPNANTIIILNADRLGLSQLYQLRGRVGRSNRLAYAYLMYEKDKVLTEVSEKRLRAIKEFTEFGAGFKVAMRDLEIRGAGNVLGTAQSGHMINIGYELYCKLINDAVKALSGEIVNTEREETSVELKVTAFIPDRYIADEITKLAMYRKIALAETEEDEEELLDELIDRFGEVPEETVDLIKVSRIRALAERHSILRIKEESITVAGKPSNRVIFEFGEKNSLKAEGLARLTFEYGPRVFIHGGVKPFIRFTLSGKIRDKLKEVIDILEKM